MNTILFDLIIAIGAAIASPYIKDERIAGWIRLIPDLLTLGDQANAEMSLLTEQIKDMVAAGREPTLDEWDALDQRLLAASSRIGAA